MTDILATDHDTGGLGIVDGDVATGEMTVRWSTGYHTGQWVPLFAFGPGAGRLSGVFDNNEIPVLIANLLGIDGFPALRP
ncbi:MAG: hypothetical protein PVG53_00535 [Holophagae bacterium]|jgi:alkaline phosphatase